MGEMRGVYRVLLGKPERKRPHRRPRRRWGDTTKMDLQKVGCGVWTESNWLRLGTCECGIEPSGSINCREFHDKLKTG
jgi:hypothetical protein